MPDDSHISTHLSKVGTSRVPETFPLLLWLSFFFLAFTKLWLVSGQRLTAFGAAIYDDRLFLNLASSLRDGEWLGSYNELTLVKGPFYPIWIATIFKTGIPLLLSQHILYITACFVFVIAIRPLLGSPFAIFFVYLTILFNPMSYTNEVMTRVLREGIYPALTILVISFTIGFLVRCDRKPRNIILWSIGLGLSVSAFWITREEGIWILPSIFIMLGFAVIRIWSTRPLNLRKASLLILPFLIWTSIVGGISGVNKARYGVFNISELKSPEFLNAYSALLRVKHDRWQPTVPVPEDVRKRIYKASPAFNELAPFLEGDLGKAWASEFKNIMEEASKDPDLAKKIELYLSNDPSNIWEKAIYINDIHGGHFLWALRDSAAAAGYHQSWETASVYYNRLAREVNLACFNGNLHCGTERHSLMPSWRDEYTVPFMKTLFSSALYLSYFRDFDATPEKSIGEEGSLELFRDMTGDQLSPSEFQIKGWAFSPGRDIDISIRSAGGETVDTRKFFFNSPDVYDHFLSKGMDFPEAHKARFNIIGNMTYELLPRNSLYFLYIEGDGGMLKQMPLDGSIKSVVSKDLYLSLDYIDYTGFKNGFTEAERNKFRVLNMVGGVYQYLMPFLSGLALIIYTVITIRILIKGVDKIFWVICASLLLAIIARLTILSVIHVNSFITIIPQYLSPCYPLLLVFTSLIISDTITRMRSRAFSSKE